MGKWAHRRKRGVNALGSQWGAGKVERGIGEAGRWAENHLWALKWRA